jgi:NAD(P)-dependent dehydrogenase (short-subunit alcohol dehydrogenase family)
VSKTWLITGSSSGLGRTPAETVLAVAAAQHMADRLAAKDARWHHVAEAASA